MHIITDAAGRAWLDGVQRVLMHVRDTSFRTGCKVDATQLLRDWPATQEGYERLEDGSVTVRGSLGWQTHLARHHRYVPLIALREIAPSETDNPDDTVLTARIDWTPDDALAVAAAIVALVGDGGA